MADFFWFSDEQWARIKPLLPTGLRGARRVDDRRVPSGIVHALQSGGRWAERGIWQDIFSTLAGAEGVPDRLFIDSTCIKVHRTAGGQGLTISNRLIVAMASWPVVLQNTSLSAMEHCHA